MSILDIRDRVQRARSVAVLTGAGISADSGVPTFRGPDGLWRNYRPEELASPDAFARDPALVWEWYNWRRELLHTKHPNPAHEALASLERTIPHMRVVTQNVDGLHRAAGSRNITELHGNIWRVRCTGCGTVNDNRDVPIAIPPHCGDCGSLLRPHIVWFGESLNPQDIDDATTALETCEILLIIGTSGLVYPAASFASVAKGHGAYVVELNLDPTPNSSTVDDAVHGRAKDLVPLLCPV